MRTVQLRRYEIKPGEMDDFVAAWRGVVPVREQYGFAVAFAVIDREQNEFVWAVTHDGDFASKKKRCVARQLGRCVGRMGWCCPDWR